MKIIKPSAHIIEEELSQLSVYQRIDRCASVCYQRPPKSTEEEAQKFCNSMLDRKHYATLEMAQIHLVVDILQAECLDTEKYLYVSTSSVNGDVYVASGSVRAWLESSYKDSVTNCLNERYSLFFDSYNSSSSWNNVRFALTEEIPLEHKYVAARFIVNRAVSHELVRHRPCSFLQESQRYCRYEDDVIFIEPLWTARGAWLHNEWLKDMAYDEERYKFRLLHKLTPQEAREKLPNSTKTELIIYASLPEWQHIFNLRCSLAADPEMRRVMIPLREEFKEKYQEVKW